MYIITAHPPRIIDFVVIIYPRQGHVLIPCLCSCGITMLRPIPGNGAARGSAAPSAGISRQVLPLRAVRGVSVAEQVLVGMRL